MNLWKIVYFFGGQRHHFKQFKPYYNNLILQKLKAGAAHQLVLSGKPHQHLYIMGRGYGIGKYQDAKGNHDILNFISQIILKKKRPSHQLVIDRSSNFTPPNR